MLYFGRSVRREEGGKQVGQGREAKQGCCLAVIPVGREGQGEAGAHTTAQG